MTRAPGRTAVFVAPTGTPPTAADAWTLVGYAEDFTLETAYESRPHPPVSEPLAAEEPR